MIRAVNDHAVIEIETKKYGQFVSNEPPKGFESGILVSISDIMPFFGTNGELFQASLMDEALTDDIQEVYAELIGKKVYWPEYSDRGVVVEHEGKTYCLMKLSLLTAYEEGEE